MANILSRLLKSENPSIVYKTHAYLLGKDPRSSELQSLQNEIKSSSFVQHLLSERDSEGKIPYHPYKKWFGAHWVLSVIADLDYPEGDESLFPLKEQVFQWLLSEKYEKKYARLINGRYRKCASMEGNALYYLLKLGLEDERVEILVDRLRRWQWEDGGWNCDKNPAAQNSSFMESLLPLRGLNLYSHLKSDELSRAMARRASDIFFKRHLYKRQQDGHIMRKEFAQLYYPYYWHYNILVGLKVLAEGGFLPDERCKDALDLLQSKQLPDGGFPAERKYYQVTDNLNRSGRSLVNWGGTGKKRMNEFITVDALYVLKNAGYQAK
ncbi:MAG: hypothetical protein ACFFFG_15010 [Candidatus Thorarchaeota archaeon]